MELFLHSDGSHSAESVVWSVRPSDGPTDGDSRRRSHNDVVVFAVVPLEHGNERVAVAAVFSGGWPRSHCTLSLLYVQGEIKQES